MSKRKKMKSTTEESELEPSIPEVVEDNICITCSTLGECEDVLILTFEGTDFINIVDSCIGFRLSGQEKLKHMCLECINTIISFHTFKTAALKSYEELCKKEAKIKEDTKPECIKSKVKYPDNTSESSEHIVFLNIEDGNLIDIDDEVDNDNTTESVVPNISNNPSEVDTTELKTDGTKAQVGVMNKLDTDNIKLEIGGIELEVDGNKLEVDGNELDLEFDAEDSSTTEECQNIKEEITIIEEEDISLDEINKPKQLPIETVQKKVFPKLSMKELKEQNQWQCSYCNIVISKNNPAGIKKHRYTEKAKRLRIYECPVCHRKYTKQVIKEHILRHGEDKPVFCKICKKGVSSKQALTNHMMLHYGKKYRCEVCKKGFTQQFLLKEHMSTHDKDTAFLCPTCGMSFPNATRLRQHLYTHKKKSRRTLTQDAEPPNICDVCGKGYSSAKTLEVHRTKHSSDEKFECGRCGKEFGHRALLTSHVWLHIVEFRCQKCFKIFQKDDLRKHECIPLPEGHVFDDFLPTECQKCGEILQDGMMNRHMRRHEARVCKVCGEKFFTARKFQFHLNTHNLKCPMCGKKFVKNESYFFHTSKKVCEKVKTNGSKKSGSLLKVTMPEEQYI